MFVEMCILYCNEAVKDFKNQSIKFAMFKVDFGVNSIITKS